MRDLISADRDEAKVRKPDNSPASASQQTEQTVAPGKRPSPKQVLQMQRTHGNQAVQRMLGNVQRQEAEPPASTSSAPAAGGPTSIGDGSAQITAKNGIVEITGAQVSVNAASVNNHAAIVTNDGVVRAGTLLADSVVAANYTPGAGNVM